MTLMVLLVDLKDLQVRASHGQGCASESEVQLKPTLLNNDIQLISNLRQQIKATLPT